MARGVSLPLPDNILSLNLENVNTKSLNLDMNFYTKSSIQNVYFYAKRRKRLQFCNNP